MHPAGLSACGGASCLRICPGLGAWAGVVGTSLDISSCLGFMLCRHAQRAPREQLSVLEMGRDAFWVLDGCLQMRVPEASTGTSNRAASGTAGTLSLCRGLYQCSRDFRCVSGPSCESICRISVLQCKCLLGLCCIIGSPLISPVQIFNLSGS